MINEKKLGMLGFGEAAQNIVDGLIKDGYNTPNIIAYDLNYSFLSKKAEDLKIKLYNDLDQFLKNVDFLIVLLPCSVVLQVAQNIIKKIKPDCAYLDLSTSYPEDQNEIEKMSFRRNINYCDGAILGSLAKFKHQAPIVISGKKAEIFKEYLGQWNMNITIVGERAGQASAIKLCRSIYSKGTQALLVELIKATEHYEVTDIVLDSFEKTWFLEGFISETNRLIESTRNHLQRRKDEINYAIEMLEKANLPAYMSKGSSKVFELFKDEYEISYKARKIKD